MFLVKMFKGIGSLASAVTQGVNEVIIEDQIYKTLNLLQQQDRFTEPKYIISLTIKDGFTRFETLVSILFLYNREYNSIDEIKKIIKNERIPAGSNTVISLENKISVSRMKELCIRILNMKNIDRTIKKSADAMLKDLSKEDKFL